MKALSLWFALCVLLGGCNYRKEKLEMPLNTNPTFHSVMHYVLEPKCVSCHTGPSSPSGVDLSNYQSLMKFVTAGDSSSSLIVKTIVSGRMPKGQSRLPEMYIQMVKSWIDAGAMENGDAPPPPSPPAPTFQWISENLFAKRCVGCHSGENPKTALDLRTYVAIMSFSGEIFKAIEPNDPDLSGIFILTSNGTMPPEGKTLSEEETDVIREWIKEGAKP